MLNIHTEFSRDRMLLRLCGDMTVCNAATLEKNFAESGLLHRCIEVCLAEVDAIDICGIYVLLRTRARLHASGGAFSIGSRRREHREQLAPYGIEVIVNGGCCAASAPLACGSC